MPVKRLVPVGCSLVVFSLGATAHAVPLPFIEDWDSTGGETYTTLTSSLAGAPEWSYEPASPGGRLRLDAGDGFANTPPFAATLDRSPASNAVTNFLTLTLDMAEYDVVSDTILLEFEHAHHGDENSANDRVWVRGSSADPFIQLHDLTVGGPSSGTYQSVTGLDVSGALAGASQQFSSTFQVRFGQEDDFPADSPTGTDGRSFDDIALRLLVPDDVAATAIVEPFDGVCGDPMQDIAVEVTNFGGATQSDIPLHVEVTGDIVATFDVLVPGPLVTGQSELAVVGQIDAFAGATIDIEAETVLLGDLDTTNDLVATTVTLPPTAITLESMPAPTCPSTSATIDVVPEPEVTFELYDVELGGDALDSGDMLVTLPIDGDTTFWLERVRAPASTAAFDNSIGDGSQYAGFEDGLQFDVLAPTVLEAVHVYPGTLGVVEVVVHAPGGLEIGTSGPITVDAEDIDTKMAVPIGIELAPGAGYRLSATPSTATLFRNTTGATFPYDSSALLTVTSAVPDLAGVYYFFYDWVIRSGAPVCGDSRTPVDVTVDPMVCSADLVTTLDGPTSAEPGETVQYTTTVTNAGAEPAPGVSVSIPTPAGLVFVSNENACVGPSPCDLGDMDPGAVETITSTFTIEDDFEGEVEVTASATMLGTEVAPGDEDDSVTTEVASGEMGTSSGESGDTTGDDDDDGTTTGGGGSTTGGDVTGGVSTGDDGVADSTGGDGGLPPPDPTNPDPTDAGETGDADDGTDGGAEPSADDGGCRVGGRSGPTWAWVLFGLAALARRRRR